MMTATERPLKILHLCYADYIGGAARAAFRIHEAIRSIGVESRMAVMEKHTLDIDVLSPNTAFLRVLSKIWANMANAIESVVHRRSCRRLYNAAFPGFFKFMKIPFSPDIIHLHLLSGNMVRVEDLNKFSQPIVWTLHDEWPLTGGCAYDGGCERFKSGCGYCPKLSSTRLHDQSRRNFNRKFKSWGKLKIAPVAPCLWMKTKIEASQIFHNKNCLIIPNAINHNIFRPIDKEIACKVLGLNPSKRYILFGAMGADPRKGGDLLAQALRQVNANRQARDELELLVFGMASGSAVFPPDFPVHYCGLLHDDITLMLNYCAAELFVAPSREDNLPNTVIEALACDVPVVAFNIGGMPDMITHKITGWLAKPFDVSDMASGILWILENRKHLNGNMRKFALNRFDSNSVAYTYVELYNKLLQCDDLS